MPLRRAACVSKVRSRTSSTCGWQTRARSLSRPTKAEINLKTSFRAIERPVYEKAHPGRIEKNGLKVAKCKTDCKIIEVVIIPKLPGGHFDLDANDIQGAVMEDIVDDGQAAIRDGQVQDKFDSLVKGALAEVNQCLGNAELEEQAHISEAEDVRQQTDKEGTDDESESIEEDEDLTFVRDTFFNLSTTQPSIAPSSKNPAKRKARAALPSPSPDKSGHAAASTRTTHSTSRRNTRSTPETKPVAPQQPQRKFEGKPPEEILEFGLPLILQDLEEAERLMGHAAMDHRMNGEALYINALMDIQKKMQTVHKSVVNLDIKVKKWTVIPENLKDYMLDLRKKGGCHD